MILGNVPQYPEYQIFATLMQLHLKQIVKGFGYHLISKISLNFMGKSTAHDKQAAEVCSVVPKSNIHTICKLV